MPSQTETNITTLLLVRHGETDSNASGAFQGAGDDPLNERGRAQAQLVAGRLRREQPLAAAIYASPLRRAQETAAAIAGAFPNRLPLRVVPDLAEYNLGEWEGLTYEQLRNEKRLWAQLAADPHFAPPGGESAVAFATRTVGALQGIAADHAGGSVIVVSHGGALATAVAVLVEGDADRWPSYQMRNCAFSELLLQPQPKLGRLNVTDHLAAVGFQEGW